MISGFPFREKGAETERALPLQFTGNNDTKRWVRFVRGGMALFGVKLFFFFFFWDIPYQQFQDPYW